MSRMNRSDFQLMDYNWQCSDWLWFFHKLTKDLVYRYNFGWPADRLCFFLNAGS